MRGTRYGDFSRFQPEDGGDAALLMQQGRVLLDADFNAQAELAERRLREAVADLIGGNGGPGPHPGFEIRPRIALAFDGCGRAVVDDAPALRPDPCAPVTIELWAQWRGGEATLFDWAGLEEWGPGALRMFVDEHGRPGVAMREYEVEHVVLAGRRPLPRTRLARIVFISGERTMRLCVDGEQVAEGARTGPAIGPGRLAIGGRVDGPAPCLRGDLAGLRAWASAHVEEGPPEGDDDLAWWPMDDEHGDHAREVVAGRRATLVGDPRPAWRIVDFDIEPGRYYVEGIACRLDHRRRYSRQRLEPYAPLPHAPGRYVVYLETWEETVSTIQEPALADPALGGLDTTVRARAASAVRLARLPGGREDVEESPDALLAAGLDALGPRGRMAAQLQGDVPPGNDLYRVEVHGGGRVGDGPAHEAAIASIRPRRREVELREPWPGVLEAGDQVEISGHDDEHRLQAWRYVVSERVHDHRCVRLTAEPTAAAELRGARLRPAPPTFKWSRRNGADVQAILPVPEGRREVYPHASPPGPPVVEPGSVVEVLDDDVAIDGPPPPMMRVLRLDRADGGILLSEPVPDGVAADARSHPFLRRWDQPAEAHAHDYAVPIEPGRWHEIEPALGLGVRFEPGHYRRGDYWWILTRQDEHGLDWPQGQEGPRAIEPEGVERRRAPLALALVGERDVEVVDLRATIVPSVLYDPVVERPVGGAPPPASEDAAREEAEDARRDEGEDAGPAAAGPDGPEAGTPPAPEAAAPEAARSAAPEAAAPEPPEAARSVAPEAAAPAAAEHTGADEAADAPSRGGADPAGAGSAGLRAGAAAIPAGFALVGPAGASVPGFTAIGAEVLTRRRWRRRSLGVPGDGLQSATGFERGLVLATTTGVWTSDGEGGPAAKVADLPEPREGFACRAVGALVLLVGGRVVGGHPDGVMLALSPASGEWSVLPPMPLPVGDPAVAVHGDAIHVLGGRTRAFAGRVRTETAHQVYEGDARQWRQAPGLPEPRYGAQAATRGGWIHVVGGRGGRSGIPLTAHVAYVADAGSWRALPPSPQGEAVVAAAAAGREIVALSRREGEHGVSAHAYDVEHGQWEPVARPPDLVPSAGLAVTPTEFVAVGHASGVPGAVAAGLPCAREWTLFVAE